MQTKIVLGWECDCPEYPHNSLYCANRRRVAVEIPTDPEWRVSARRRVSRETRPTDLPPEQVAVTVGPDDVTKREISHLLAIPGVRGTYARGYPPGDVAYRGECPSCAKTVLVKLDGDLRQHKCISVESVEGGHSAMQPVHDTIRPVPIESIVIRGSGWRIVYENNKFYQGWVVNDGVWTQVGAVESKQRALQ